MEGSAIRAGSACASFPRVARGWKEARNTGPPAGCVSPALRGDGRLQVGRGEVPGGVPPRYAGMEGVNRAYRVRRYRFPPRYAGMEGKQWRQIMTSRCFPRATRGWKGVTCDACPDLQVSPALRGDGRDIDPRSAPTSLFPPRYAGMEGESNTSAADLGCFPRATRGWKVDVDWVMGPILVSPALRGDERW